MSKSVVKDKEKPLQDKLKTFFSRRKASGPIAGTLPRGSSEPFAVGDDVLLDVGPEMPFGDRVRAMKELADRFHLLRLENGLVESLWKRVADLLEDFSPHGEEGKVIALCFLTKLVEDHGSQFSGPMRSIAFRTTVRSYHPIHLHETLALFSALTESGRKATSFEMEVGPFLLKLFPDVLRAQEKSEFLRILDNVIKFNAAYLDPPILTAYIRCLANLCSWTGMESEIDGSLAVLNAIVSYSYLPTEALEPFTRTLCTLANYRDFCPRAWKTMRDLLGTCLGHTTIYVMAGMLQRYEDFVPDYAALRGAVFFLSMSLWSAQRVIALKHTPVSVLPAIAKVLECDTTLISYEVALSMKRLVIHRGKEQFGPTWDLVFSIVSKLLAFCERKPCPDVNDVVQETLTAMERVVTEANMADEAFKLYGLIEQCAATRPEESLFSLLEFWAERITPIRSQWLENLHRIMLTYFKKETRGPVRQKALEILRRTYADHNAIYEEELVESVILPFLEGVENDKNVAIREKAAGLLVDVALNLQSKKFMRIVEILEKIVRQPFGNVNKGAADTVTIVRETDVADVKVAIRGLTRIFQVKLFLLPSEHCIRVYQVLVAHLLLHYRKVDKERRPEVDIENAHLLRSMIFECFLSLRADNRYHLGCMDEDGSVMFSPYLMVDHRRGESHSQGLPSSPVHPSSRSTSPPPASPSALDPPIGATASSVFPSSPYPPCKVLSLTQACGALIEGLKKERHWSVLSLLLSRLPDILGNKALTLSRNGNDIHYLVDAACALVKPGANEKLTSLDQATAIDLQAYAFPVLIALVPYHCHVDPDRQRSLINAITFGLRSSRSASCIDALTMSALEMTDTMHKIIPYILSQLSTLSATVPIALPVLLFLSTLIRLPGVYKSFIEDQYRLIFAIALQYTNPVKFEHSVIKLAHHVIAMWFLKCRLPLRRQLVPYITKGLDDHALKTTAARAAAKTTHEEEGVMERQNSNSSSRPTSGVSSGGADELGAGWNRPRSSSLHERVNPYKREAKPGPNPATADESLLTAQQELAMTCLDLMARYSYAHVSPMSRRSPVSDFLLQNGFSESWIYGNEIITITTSGCSHRPMGPSGLCDHCWTKCLGNASASREFSEPSTPLALTGSHIPVGGGLISDSIDSPRRKRHQSDFTTGSPSQTSSLLWNSTAKDDLHVWNNEDGVAQGGLIGEGASIVQRPAGAFEQDGRVLCCCHCQGWAEIHIRRPCGSTSWMMKIQNASMKNRGICDETVLGDAMSLLIPGLQGRARGDAEVESLNAPVNDPSLESGAVKERGTPTDVCDIADDQSGVRRHASASPATGLPSTTTTPATSGMLKPRRSDVESAGLHGIEEEDKARESPTSFEAPQLLDTNPASNRTDLRPAASNRSLETSPTNRPSPSSSQDSPSPVAPSANQLPSASPSSPIQTRPHASHLHRNSVAGTTAAAALAAASGRLSSLASGGSSALASNISGANEAPFRERSRTVTSAGRIDRLQSRLMRNDSLNGGVSSASLANAAPKDPGERAGINPKFVFLQLFYGAQLTPVAGPDAEHIEETTPILLPKSREVERSIKNLDYMYPFETHKIGVVYVGPGQLDTGQESEKLILSNHFGSPRYIEFMQGLGEIICLADVDLSTTFLGGLATVGTDGDFAITWKDDLMQVIFHVATLMPTTEVDPNCNNKKRHIGNDFVLIVYNESGKPYEVSLVKGQVIQSWVEIQPLPHGCNKIIVHARSELEATLCAGGRPAPIISDRNLALYARQVALHADLLCCFYMEAAGKSPHSSKWLERLRQIRRLRTKVWEERPLARRQHHQSGKDSGSPNKSDSSATAGQGSAGASSPRPRRPIVQRVASFSDFV